MTKARFVRTLAWAAAGVVGLGAAAYAAYAGIAWLRYGRGPKQRASDDALLDRFMPDYEVAGRHRFQVAAPAEVTLAAATEMDLQRSAVIRAIFKGRELILGAEPETRELPRGLLAQTKALGWGLLAEVPGREIVMGAVTQPWVANVVFRALPPEQFAAFDEPGYVKIAWTLRADPVGPQESVFSTETRVATTDAVARARFRRYWAFFSPGIILVRLLQKRPLRAEAARRARAA